VTFSGFANKQRAVGRWARARALAHRFHLELASLSALLPVALILACTRNWEVSGANRLEPALRQVVAQHPDSLIGVLLRLTRNVQREDSAALTRSGFVIGSARDRIVTGWAKGRTLRQLSGWPHVEWVEMSASIPMTPRRTDDLRSAGRREK
jgi:hypothetical protein